MRGRAVAVCAKWPPRRLDIGTHVSDYLCGLKLFLGHQNGILTTKTARTAPGKNRIWPCSGHRTGNETLQADIRGFLSNGLLSL